MAYRLNQHHAAGANVQRIAREELAAAQRELRTARAANLHDSVHAARKRLKRVRSLMRLARPGLKQREFRRINHALRNIGRGLSATRDRHIVMQTRRSILGRRGNRSAARSSAVTWHKADRAACATAAGRIASLLRLFERWPLGDISCKDLERGEKRQKRRCRKAQRAASKKPAAANMHEWRKRVKDIQHILELRGRSKSPKYRAIKRLAQVLGNYHDLDVLDASMRKKKDSSETRSKIRRKQATLRAAAFNEHA